MSIENMKKRLSYDAKMKYTPGDSKGIDSNYIRLKPLGGADQWVRMREAKLDSLMKALFYSYQAAIIRFDKDDRQYNFRCLINHDKLKVDYEDKIISIPYFEVPENGTEGVGVDVGIPLEDNVDKYRILSGSTFQWLSGNEEYMEDTHWMIYLQYSEETAYFRGEIRQCKDIIEIIDEDDNVFRYYAWSKGPNEEEIVWNIKKGVTWNDLNYTREIYITKDKDTTCYFERFNRVKIANGKFKQDSDGNYIYDDNGELIPLYDWWEVQAVNPNYGNGIIKLALKETYTNTAREEAKPEKAEKRAEEEAAAAESKIKGEIFVYPYQRKTFTIADPIEGATWSISNNKVAKIINQDSTSMTLEITTGKSLKEGFDVIYGEDNKLHVVIKSL